MRNNRGLGVVLKALASLKLTIVCLILLMVVVVCCTLAQTSMSAFDAVHIFIRSFVIRWAPLGTSWRVAVFPGGALIGFLLLLNLIASGFYRLKPSWKNLGLWLTHSGLIVLFVGEFSTAFFAVETHMAIEEGSTRNYTESDKDMELVIVDATDNGFDEVVSIPQNIFSRQMKIEHPKLPFSLLIKRYYPNSSLAMSAPSGSASLASAGIGVGAIVTEAPVTKKDDERNQVSAFVEFISADRSLGTWLLSNGLGAQQSFSYLGRTYQVAIRPTRYYLPFSITLKDFKHDQYPGTDIPKNFSSLVELKDSAKAQNRDVLIYMNHPLRYGGKTFYQASFGKGDTLSILQVVENPGWLLPYIACVLVAAGLLIHFLLRLILGESMAL